MLKLNNIQTSYGKVGVLWDISLEVQEGEIVALVGANGAGKTTLLKTITGLVSPTSGTMEFLGERIDGLQPYMIAQKGISYVPEGGKPFPEMTVLENLEMGSYFLGAAKEMEETLQYVYQNFPILKERNKQLASTLSGGERQMLAMGRSLMSKPRLCMFDEPSYGLAPLVVKQLFEFIKTLHDQGMTIFIIEQNVKHALEAADRAYVIENGHIVLSGTSDELLHNEHVMKAYLGL